ncbi:ALA-interacting subunit 5 [Tritrichomonas foetus]|uniref:ALA-interacting subunit 5 n=1 Tax=Tritrichomonas foetus TaxID=1144522 RepID=A0A1J4JSE3_9EUKA|nr:ALA-interacting subunit 5 [Tritrichomonas foetus]|eukprot:OHT00165.1 ALA-interacting subunit 5 [Tritrichomonas foetus]
MLKGFTTPLTDEKGAPMQTVFSQQRIEAWRPLFTPTIVIIILFTSGILLSGLGVLFYFISKNIVEVDYRYDDYCAEHYPNSTTCILPIEITKEMTGTVYILYRLTNFYQNHQRYVSSRCDAQLRGEYVDYDGMSYCGDFRSHNGSEEKEDWILPCGAIATSLFNDTFDFYVNNASYFQSIGISWRSDREKLFKKLSTEYNGTGDLWLDRWNESFPRGQRDEHFIIWMRTAALPSFMKTYGRNVESDIKPGMYNITIENNYPTSLFNGEKHVVLSTVSSLGGKNDALGLSYLIVGGLLFFFGIVVLVSQVFFPRKLGDVSYINIASAAT